MDKYDWTTTLDIVNEAFFYGRALSVGHREAFAEQIATKTTLQCRGNLMDKALQKIALFGNQYAIQWLQKQFACIQRMQGANRIFRRIALASDKEQLDDYLAEVKYAVVFAGLGFQVEIEPCGSKGPDLKVSRDGLDATVEVMRFRKMYPGPPVLDLENEGSILPEYGNPPRDIRKAFEKILAKFPQMENELAIIAIWNDDGDLEELEVATAVNDLRRDAYRRVLSLPEGLWFVLYGSNAVRAGDHKQLYCFPLRHVEQKHQVTWQQELDISTVSELIQRALTN
jgi:hypothetical protein